MFKAIIFGGTTEGRELARFCASCGISADVSVTTEYGAQLLADLDFGKILVGRLDAGQMEALLKRENYGAVIDATHPYAKEASANVKAACESAGTPYYRLLRDQTEKLHGTVLDGIPEAVEILNRSDKKALIATGSKTLSEFTAVRNYRERLTVRVLPAEGIREQCAALGFAPEKIIAEKGPFTVEQNIAQLRRAEAEILVTKESGAAGGYPEKAEAARLCAVLLLTIRRPAERGFSMEQIQKILWEQRTK